MTAQETKAAIKKHCFVPILRTDKVDVLDGIAQCVCDAQIQIMEVTMTIPGIIESIPRIKEKYPNLLLGLGTVYDKKDAESAIKNGVDFIVTPMLNMDIVDTVKSANKCLILAGMTPTEVYNAHCAGSDIVKVFPASVVGPNFIRELKGPMPFIDFLPTGGLNLTLALQYLSMGCIAVGLGSTLFRKEMIDQRDFEGITNLLKIAKFRIGKLHNVPLRSL